MKKYSLFLLSACLTGAALSQNLGDKTLFHAPLGTNYADYGPAYLTGTASGNPGNAADARANASQALSLNGTDDYVSFGSPSSYQHALPLSFSVWVYLNNTTGNYPVFCTDNTGDAYAGIFLQIANGIVYMSYGDGNNYGSENRVSYQSSTVLTSGKWFHIAGVFRGYRDFDMYIDGVKETGGNYSGGSSFRALGYKGANMGIGTLAGKGGGAAQYFPGRIDDLHIWNRTLSQAEVLQKKNALLVYSFIPGGQLEDSGPGGIQGSNTGCASAHDRYGRNGQSIYLDGSSSKVGLPFSTVYRQSFPLTLTAWVNITTQKTFQPIITTSDHSANKYTGVTLYLENGKPAITCGDNTGAGMQFRRSLVAPDSLKTRKWYQVTAVCSSLTSWKIYVNGVEITGATASGTGTTMAHGTGSGYMGFLTDAFSTGDRYFHGHLDEVMVFGNAFTGSEVASLYRAGLLIQHVSDDTAVQASTAFNLKVTATAEEPISYLWQKKNAGIWQNISTATKKDLQVASTTDNDTGWYRCIVSVTNYSDTTAPAHVTFIPVNKTGGGHVKEIILSPNPVQGILYLKGMEGTFKAELLDSRGNRIMKTQMHDNGQMDLSSASPGIYLLVLSKGNATITHKIIVQ
ncbi:MAG: T9SS type A sorting domain-containing protein [Bacteroidetes bacterium]|nr:T9SS type A sorting domain-containing protein [Bacteroidota bacterium]